MDPKRTGSRAGGRAGFTLIEVMVSMVIMSVGLFAIAHMIVISVRASSYGWERTTALEIAHAAIEELQARSNIWIQRANVPSQFEDGGIFDDIGLAAEPAPGLSMAPEDVAALLRFGGSLDIGQANQIASAPTREGAYAINQFGAAREIVPGSLASEGAIFRVNYIAFPFTRTPDAFHGMAARNWNLVYVLVIVSWDNKDHGEQDYAWTDWDSNFWKRHMVVVPTFIMPGAYL